MLDKLRAIRCRVEMGAFILTSILLLCVYGFTLAPSVNLELSGILITAADRLGVSITPGQPLWTMLAFLFSRMFGWATFLGHPNPAWGVHWLCAVCGALSGGLVAWWVCRLSRLGSEQNSEPLNARVSVLCGVSAGMMTGLGSALWSQSVVAETFSMHLALTLFTLLLLDSWIRDRSVKALYGAFLSFGLTVTTQHQGLVLLPLLLGAMIVQRPKLRNLLWLPVLFIAGFLPLLYLPLASAQHPPVNWGYACTWDGFMYTIMRGQFERIVFTDIFGNPLLACKQLLFGFRIMASQSSLPVLLLAVPGIYFIFRFSWRSGVLLASAILLYTVGMIWGINPRMDDKSGEVMVIRYLIPACAFMAILTGVAIYSMPAILFGKFRCGKWVIWFLPIFLPLAALYMSLADSRNLMTYGSPSQRGNTFGWQFGAGILNGQRGLIEVLPDGTTFPDADYPPPLAPDSVLFGGSDPGRFVPTYMVFGAELRPDVAVLTQNALASEVYMMEMRDLYGEKLWIPAQEDMQRAFQRFVHEANVRGRADTGVGGVMEINGILARSIFLRNKQAHEFYVEESYVVPWMYPYLSPHGLIMKLNRKPVD
ncbi:MAG: DUF2723 domain-containing protein, partial [Kiritimatiellaceae bacterium]|nr:DUF2723 domain-containing protein [Kiritimatiellaceae bacterium]